ncbi:MAG: hypothetical protein AAB289_12745 [Chloroflexota bacterium]
MTLATQQLSIGTLDDAIARLSSGEAELFHRLYRVIVTEGKLRTPPSMRPWVEKQFGSVAAVESQRIVRVTNRITMDDVLFNALRSQRPIQMRDGARLMEMIETQHPNDPLGHPLEGTPEDVFGRLQGKHSVTAANIAKLDSLSSLIVFDNYNPLEFNREQVVDYITLGWSWAQQANAHDPSAVYYFFLWNCLWKAGASLLHGHAQMLLGRDMHYGKVERLRRDALGYQGDYGGSYFDDLFAVHRSLGLAFEKDGVRVIASLTPVKEKETLILAEPFDPELPYKVYDVLSCFRDHLGVVSFNITLYQGPVGPVTEDWSGFPNIVHLLDRGDPTSQTADMGSMEIYAASVVASDPFHVARALHEAVL